MKNFTSVLRRSFCHKEGSILDSKNGFLEYSCQTHSNDTSIYHVFFFFQCIILDTNYRVLKPLWIGQLENKSLK